MTNSFFNFTEAPDFASAIADTYDSVNQSFDRAEQLERENDRTREINAAMPLKMIKALADFAPTAKKIADQMAMERYIKNSALPVPTKDSEEYSAFLSINKELDEFTYLNDELKSDALKEKNVTKYDAVANDSISKKKARDIIFESDRITWSGEVQRVLSEYYKSGADPAQANAFLNSWWQQKKENLIAAGYNNRYIEFFGRKTFDEIKTNQLNKANEAAIQKRNLDEKNLFIQQVDNAVKSADPITALHLLADKNKARHGGNIGASYRDLGTGIIGMVKAKVLPYDTAVSFFDSIVEAKGDNAKALIDKLGGSAAANVQIQEWREALEDARKSTYEAIQTRDANDKTAYVTTFKDTLYKDGNIPTKEEIVDHIYINPETKYDWSLGPLPAEVNKFLSAETQQDSILIPLLEQKAKLKTLTMEDVMKINNSSIRAQYASQVSKTGGGVSASGTYLKIGTQASARIASAVTEENDGNKDRSLKWGNIQAQVNLLYPSVYADKLSKSTPDYDKDGNIIPGSAEAKAHGEAQRILLEKAQDGDFDTWGKFTSNTQAKLSAIEHIKSGGETEKEINTWLGNNIIVGTEAALKQAQSFPEGSTQTALMYKQIGDDIGIPGHILQAKQLEAAAILEGKKLPIKSAITLAYEKMSDKEKRLLPKVSPARLARMKFEAYMNTPEGGEEGTITYDELLALHPSVIEYNKQTEELNQQATAEKDTQLKPKKGDWKPLPKGTYVQFDGKDWRQVGWTFGGQAYEGDVDEYIDKDLVRRQF